MRTDWNVLAIALQVQTSEFKLEWLETFVRFSPEVAYRRVGNDGVWIFVRFRQERLRPDFRTRIEKRLNVVLKRLEEHTLLKLRAWGWGGGPEHAELVASFGRFEFVEDTPVSGLECMQGAFARDEQDAQAWRGWLKKSEAFGFRTLADLLEIPQAAITRRFGGAVATWVSRVREIQRQEQGAALSRCPWPQIQWPEVIEESTACPDGVASVDAIVFGLKPLLEKMSARLFARRLRVARLGLQIHTADSRTRVWEFAFPLPQTTGVGVLGIVRERLARDLEKLPLQDEVLTFEVKVLESLPARVRERELFSNTEHERESLDQLVMKLNQRIEGARADRPRAFFARIEPKDWPEDAWSRQLESQALEIQTAGDRNFQKLTRPRGGLRPLRVFSKPVARDTPSLVELAPEVERIVGEWWRIGRRSPQEGALPVIDLRDYRVEPQTGEWLFRSGEGWFSHGSFD